MSGGVAVVVCAYTERRWTQLCAAVESAAGQSPAPDEVVLVVDHNPELAALARARFDGECVRILENSRRRGLAGARNSAIATLGSDVGIVAFLDDDAWAPPGWLARLTGPYVDPHVQAVGGSATPRWPEPDQADRADRADQADRTDGAGRTGRAGGPPAVLPAELWWVVGCSYTGQAPGTDPVDVRNLMGCAMSFRRSVFALIGGFAEDMGRVGSTPLGCEETELCIRLRQTLPGARIVLDPAATVEHHVSVERTGWSYLVRRCVAEGMSKAALTRRCGSADGLAAERRYTRVVLPSALVRELRAAGQAVRHRDGDAVRERLTAAAALPTAVSAAGWGYVRGRFAEATT